MSDAGTPGWYPDPYRRYDFRYFNGQRWTGDVSVHGERMIDPVNGGQPAPAFSADRQAWGTAAQRPAGPQSPGGTQWPGPQPPDGAPRPADDGSRPASAEWSGGPHWTGGPTSRGAQPADAPNWADGPQWSGRPQWTNGAPWPGMPGAGPGGPKAKRGMAIAAFVIAVAAAAIGWFPFAFTVAGAGVVVAVVFGVIGLRRAKHQDGAGRGFAVAALVISPVALAICVGGFFFTRFVVHEVDRYNDPGSYTLTPGGCDFANGSVTYAGSIRNDEHDTRSYQLTVSYGENGRNLSTDFVDVHDVRAGQTARWRDVQRLDATGDVACDVTVHGPAPFGIQPT